MIKQGRLSAWSCLGDEARGGEAGQWAPSNCGHKLGCSSHQYRILDVAIQLHHIVGGQVGLQQAGRQICVDHGVYRAKQQLVIRPSMGLGTGCHEAAA